MRTIFPETQTDLGRGQQMGRCLLSHENYIYEGKFPDALARLIRY